MKSNKNLKLLSFIAGMMIGVLLVVGCTPNIEKLKDEQDVEGLIRALKDDSGDVREGAAEALVKIGEPAVDPLIEALKDKDSYDVREKAAEALGNIGDKRAVKPLIKALKDKGYCKINCVKIFKIKNNWRTLSNNY